MILKRKINRIYYRTRDKIKNKIKEYSPFLHELLFEGKKSLAELNDCKIGHLRKNYYRIKREVRSRERTIFFLFKLAKLCGILFITYIFVMFVFVK